MNEDNCLLSMLTQTLFNWSLNIGPKIWLTLDQIKLSCLKIYILFLLKILMTHKNQPENVFSLKHSEVLYLFFLFGATLNLTGDIINQVVISGNGITSLSRVTLSAMVDLLVNICLWAIFRTRYKLSHGVTTSKRIIMYSWWNVFQQDRFQQIKASVVLWLMMQWELQQTWHGSQL